MASKETIQRAFVVLRGRYPNYFKTNTDLTSTMTRWAREFKDTPDEVFTKAVDLVCKVSAYFPQPYELEESIRRVGYIESQKVATYLARLKTYNEYKNATTEEVDAWVDMMRAIHIERGWTTKDFKQYVEDSKEQLNESIRSFPVDYRSKNGIVEVE